MGTASTATAGGPTPKEGDLEYPPVAICHATGDGWIYNGPATGGSVAGHLGDKHQDGRDAIPSFEYREYTNGTWVTKVFPGQNVSLVDVISPDGCNPRTSVVDVSPTLSADNPCGTADDGVVVTINDAVYEPGNATYPFTVSGSSTEGFTVTFAAQDGVNYVKGPVYQLRANQFPFEECQDDEVDLSPVLSADNPCGTADDGVVVTIDEVVYEPGNPTYPFTVSGSSTEGFTVTFAAKDGVNYVNGPAYELGSDRFPLVACGSNTGGGNNGGGGSTPTAVTPEISYDDQCGTVNDKVDGVAKAGYTFVVDKAKGTVTFTPVSGYYLTTGPTLTAPLTDKPCPVTAVAPTVQQSGECDVEGSYTVPSTAGVQYLLDGEPIQAGTYTGPASGTVTARALGGSVLTDPAFSFDLDVREAEECVVAPVEGEQPVPVKPTKPNEVQGDEGEKPRVAPVVAGRPEALPTAVDAGFGPVAAAPQASLLGQGLVGGGLVMLLLAGSMQMGRRERGAHQA